MKLTHLLRTVGVAALATLLAAFTGATAATAAPPYATEATLTAIDFTENQVASGSDAQLTGSWSLPDNAPTPAGFVVDLPTGLQGLTDAFPLLDPDGETMGQCTVNATQIVCDLDSAYLAEHPRNVSGTFNFWAKVTTVVTTNTETTYNFAGAEATVIVTPANLCQVDCEWQGGATVKYGVYNRDENTIMWTVRVGSDADGATAGQQMRVEDELGPNQEFLSTYNGVAFPELRETTQFVIDQNGVQVPGPWTPAARDSYTVDGSTVSWTAKEGYFYSIAYMVRVTDGGAAGTYRNSATSIIDGNTQSSSADVVRQGGGGTGEGDQVGRFSITKDVIWNDAPIPGLTFQGTYTVTAPDGTVTNGDFTVAEDATWTSTDFTTGSLVHIQEITPTTPSTITWETPVLSNNDFAIVGATTTAVTLTNEASVERGAFTAQKELDGDAAPLADGATFFLDYTYPAGVGFPAGSGTLELPADGTVVSSDLLPLGAILTLAERTPEDVEGATWSTPQLSTTTVTIGNEEPVTVVVTNTLTLDRGVFTAAKRLEGDAASRVPAGTTFTLRYSYPAGPGFDSGEGTLTLPADGTVVTSPELPIGAEVTVSEDKPADVAQATWGPAVLSTSTFTITADRTVEVLVTNTLTEIPPVKPAPTGEALAMTGAAVPLVALLVALGLLSGGVLLTRRRRGA